MSLLRFPAARPGTHFHSALPWTGRPAAVPHAKLVLVGVEDEIERLLMAYSPRLRAIWDVSRQQTAEGKGVGHEQFWADVEARNAPKRRAKATKKPA